MAVSVESSSPDHLNKQPTSFMSSSSPVISPSSDKRFWSALRSRIDTLLENRVPTDQSFSTQMYVGKSDRSKRMKEDSLLLLRGFDSVANSLSQLSDNLDNALQGARDLARPPTITEIYQSALEKAQSKEEEEEELGGGGKENEEPNRGMKRKKFDTEQCSKDDSQKENEQSPKDEGKLKKAKNLAISMATMAASIARELKKIRSDMCFMQDRCALLEEENRRLRDGFPEGIRPEEDDLVRLQLEALLAEKSRLANQNANLTRENQCLNQLVEYHQLTSRDLSATYDHMISGMCLDFSSPPPAIPEEEGREANVDDDEPFNTPRNDLFGLSPSFD